MPKQRKQRREVELTAEPAGEIKIRTRTAEDRICALYEIAATLELVGRLDGIVDEGVRLPIDMLGRLLKTEAKALHAGLDKHLQQPCPMLEADAGEL